MRGLEFRVLGPLEVLRGGEPVPVTAPMQRALLSLFLVRRGHPTPQDELIDLLWSGDPPPTARAAFQNLVHLLRRSLGAAAIERSPAGYALRVEPGSVDLDRFDALVAESRRVRSPERAAKLRLALALWRGRPFADLPGSALDQVTVRRLEEERLGALEDRIEAELELGEHAGLVPELEELVIREPLRERLWFQLMLALYRSGRQADALAAYGRARDVFLARLGIEPGVVLRELQRAVLVQDRALDDPTRALGSTLERAAAILPRAPRERAVSLLEYGSALVRIGNLRQATSTLEAALRLAESAGERGIEERVRLQLSYLGVFAQGGSLLEHLEVAEHAVRVLEELGDDTGLAFALLQHAHMLRDTGHALRALEVAERGADLAARAGDVAGELGCSRMAVRCASLGPVSVSEALALCEATETRESPWMLWDAHAWLLAQAGRIEDARALYESELGMLREDGMVLALTVGLAYAGLAERAAGDLDRAADHLRSSYALTLAGEVRGDVAVAAGELACVLALRGEVDEAHHLGDESRATVVPGDVVSQALWRRALALVSAYRGRFDEAVALSGEAQEI